MARISLTATDGEERAFPLRKGLEVIDPAAPPPAVATVARPRVVHREQVAGELQSWYHVRLPLGAELRIDALTVALAAPKGRFDLAGLSLVHPDGSLHPLSPLAREGFRLLYRAGRVAVYENGYALTRAYTAHAVEWAANGAQALRVLRNPRWRHARPVILEDPAAPAPGGRGPSRVVVESYAPTRVALRAFMGGDGYVVLTDAHYPGWKAWVDGRPAAIYRANSMFRAVHVPGGEHRVTFAFESTTLVAGATMSVGALTAVALLLWRGGPIRPHEDG